ncbi:MAG: hypothetical protein MZU84_06675 [Sphingobacterium sp.]|nr:hypothetical protein [Sphingobacterium sp.]
MKLREHPSSDSSPPGRVYQGTTIDRYAHSLIQGISAAANEQGYSLLLGCHLDGCSRQRLDPL